jgi:hypothetical protein
MAKSHYLEKDRLANVIAAIQILSASDQATASLDRWVAELESMEELSPELLDLARVKFAERKKWATVFEQHPEFFKTYTVRGEQRVLLRWRYSQSFLPQSKNGANGGSPAAGKEAKEGDNRAPLQASPLSPDQIQVLINTAIALHAKELQAERKPERLSPFMIAAAGAALGTVAGGTAVIILGWMQMTHMIRLFN